ncbi:Membrane-anchored ribosome-binding protein, inhibits growth in stationary phase, ElaB/YqjD/DUF883 family [Roseivivax lentus]|uniref:Membrane-anchored ribosome-binding protein, inhibits growth in stationary phase, ElaB/YqjD/DUF883 family n=1 Tax=Roseivivax lentus TaxID=633194 RepID=A0A1N7PIX0_9RHOB|nr:DUF883 family protein [Roseivivax lentus]SIT10532.1 Membrane-anchored ribosome-binding protein, inhibits growth in stationary phase, ElaB/YqjD/DUF883 family [Roseivivax lentus]
MAQSDTTTRSKGSGDAGQDTEALMAQIDTLKADLASITELLGDIGARRTGETLESAKARYASARSEGERLYGEARHRAEDAQDQALEAIRRQPATAIGIAVGLGFLFGFLTSRK